MENVNKIPTVVSLLFILIYLLCAENVEYFIVLRLHINVNRDYTYYHSNNIIVSSLVYKYLGETFLHPSEAWRFHTKGNFSKISRVLYRVLVQTIRQYAIVWYFESVLYNDFLYPNLKAWEIIHGWCEHFLVKKE